MTIATGRAERVGRRLARSVVLLLTAGCSSGMSAPVVGSSPDGPLPAALAFVVQGELDRVGTPMIPEVPFPVPFALTAFLDLRKDPPVLIASHHGSSDQVPLTPIAGGWRTRDPLKVRAITAAPGCSRYGLVRFLPMDLLWDGTTIHGTFDGTAEAANTDIIYTETVRGSFTGTPDKQPPAVVVEPSPAHPGDGLGVRLSEAVRATTRVSLVAPDGSSRLLEHWVDPGQESFFLREPLGNLGGRLLIDPAPVDLIGNSAPASIPIDTVPVPLLPEDGFEGGGVPFLLGGARVIDRSAYPPVVGERSLLFPLGTGGEVRASLRLAVGPRDTYFRATVRMIDPSLDARLWLPLQVINEAGAMASPLPRGPEVPFTTVDGVSLSAPQVIEVPLPLDTKGEVLIDLHDWSPCGYTHPTAVLLDGLRVE